MSALDTEQYGTTFTTETFVREQLAQAIGEDAVDATRLPKGLCFAQDLWVVTRGPSNPEPLRHENGPNGALDQLEVNGRAFTLRGWAADMGFAARDASSHAVARVEVRFSEGTVAEAALGLPRPDIAAHLGQPNDPVLQRAGWEASGTTPRRLRLDEVVSVTAVCDHGAQFVLDSTRIDDLFVRAEASSASAARSLLR